MRISSASSTGAELCVRTPAIPHMASDFGDGGDQERPRMQVGRGLSLALNVLVHALDLLRTEVDAGRDLARGDAVVEPVQADVHLVVRQREVELVLRLRQGEGVGRGW